MLQISERRSFVCSGTLGALTFSRLLVATNSWSRLRGWYGYQPLRPDTYDPIWLDGVLLTNTASIHTIGMTFALDVFWLDSDMYCIGWHLNVHPWRCRWHRRATHVIERPAGLDDVHSLQSVCRQPLKMIPRKVRG